MTTIRNIEKILIKVNQSKANNVYFDILDLNEKEFERFKKLVSRIFKIEFNFIDVCSCMGLVELSRKIDSLYFIKYGRRYNA